MPDGEKFVGYVFCHVNKRTRTISELGETAPIRSQMVSLQRYIRDTNTEPAKSYAGSSRNRSRPFTNDDNFRLAVRRADDLNCPLVFHFGQLLSATRHDLILKCAATLDDLRIEVLDSATGTAWGTPEAGQLLAACIKNSQAKSARITAGLARRKTPSRQSSAGNRARASIAVSDRARNRAEGLRAFVDELHHSLGPDSILTPTLLSRALNQAKVPSATGRLWTAPSARNLIKRLAAQVKPISSSAT